MRAANAFSSSRLGRELINGVGGPAAPMSASELKTAFVLVSRHVAEVPIPDTIQEKAQTKSHFVYRP
jgi:hypothetical protein